MRIKISWGVGVACGYAFFSLGTVGVVVFAIHQRVDLVSPDYYAESLRQDAHAQAAERADALGKHLSIDISPHAVEIRIPDALARSARGTIRFYRPSDAAADRVAPLAFDQAGLERIPLEGLESGAWRLKLEWTSEGQGYYVEEPLWVP